MELSKYKTGLLSENPKDFYEALKELHNDLKLEENIYNSIKQINQFLLEIIEGIDSSEIIEHDLYRIIPLKHSLIYMLSIAFQTEVEVCDKDIENLKEYGLYAFSEIDGVKPESLCEANITEKAIPDILQTVEEFSDEKMFGFNDIYEIDGIIKESKLIKALNRINILKEQEDELEIKKNTEILKNGSLLNGTIDETFEALLADKRVMVEKQLEGIMKSKLTILHIPFFHKSYPSVYLHNINSIIVAEAMEDGIKESMLFAIFGLYLQCALTGSITKLPIGFELGNPVSSQAVKHRIFFDLFACKVMEGTTLEEKNMLANDLKNKPFAMKELLKDARYFNVLVNG